MQKSMQNYQRLTVKLELVPGARKFNQVDCLLKYKRFLKQILKVYELHSHCPGRCAILLNSWTVGECDSLSRKEAWTYGQPAQMLKVSDKVPDTWKPFKNMLRWKANYSNKELKERKLLASTRN